MNKKIILGNIHGSLVAGGYLILSNAETVPENQKLFEKINFGNAYLYKRIN